jgi:hypothetical protein
MTVGLALLILAQDVGELLRRLDDESIEVRTEAADLLLRRGAAVVPELEKARAGAQGELRERLGGLLERVRERERLTALLRPPTRITLAADGATLKEVVERLGARSPTPVEVAPEAAGRRVTVALRDVPFWRALEEICVAAGEVRVEPREHGVRLVPGRPDAVPRTRTDAFVIRLEGIHALEESQLGTPERRLQTMIKLRTCWEKGTRPARVRAVLERFEEDTGRNGLEGLDARPEAQSILREPGVGEELTLSFAGRPAESASKAALRASVDIDFALRWADVALPAPWAEGQSREGADFGVRVLDVDRLAGQLSFNLYVYGKARPVAADVGVVLSVRDDAGKSIESSFWSAGRAGDGVIVTGVLMAPADRTLKELRLSVPVEVHTERLTLDLPEVPLR